MKTSTQVDYEKLLWMFAENKDSSRIALQQPFKQSGYYIATDAHSLIYFPIGELNLPFEEQSDPDVFKVLPKSTEFHEPIKVNIADLEAKLIPQVIDEVTEEEKECNECEGDCVVDYEYSDKNGGYHSLEGDCPACDGAGVIETEKKTGNKVVDMSANYLIWDVGFKYKQIKRLIDACKLLGFDTIDRVVTAEETANLFQRDGISIVVMLCSIDDRNEFTKIEL